ncbi:MAG: ABC transporter permease, partial [Actinobacteria bacterium]|nr:ABC transporter permease [Actinomycetota bacterium]
LVSQRTIDSDYGWQVGQRLQVFSLPPSIQGQALSAAQDASNTLISPTIVGSYRPRDTADNFWFGEPYFVGHPSNKGLDVVDAVFTTPAVLESIASPDTAEVSADYPVQSKTIHLADVPRVRAEVAALSKKYGGTKVIVGTSGLGLRTGIDSVFRDADHGFSLVDVGTLLVTLQLAVLAWLVLFQVMADSIEARGSEIALAKLRGLRPMATLRFGLAEPLLLLVAAIPFAVLVAELVVHLLAGTLLAGGVPVALTWSTVWAVLAGFTGGCVAALLAARRTLTRPILEQWRRTGTPRASRAVTLGLDLVIAAAAVAGLVLLRRHAENSAHSSSVGLLAPGLLVLAVGLLGVRLLPLITRGFLPATRASARIGTFLALRQVSRRPAALRLAALLAVAVGLATFALAGESVAGANRQDRARAELGAPRVLSVQYGTGHDPMAARHAADPQGKWSMATARWLPDGGGWVNGTVLGVDAGRLSSTTYSVPGLPSASHLQQVLAADTLPPIAVTGRALRARITTTSLTAVEIPRVIFNVSTPGQSQQQIYAQPLTLGAAEYTAAVPCANKECTLTGVTWERGSEPFNTNTGTVVISSIDQQDASGNWQPLDSRLHDAEAWRSIDVPGYSTDKLTVTPDGLQDEFSNTEGASSAIEYAASPRPLTVIATPSAVAVRAIGQTGPTTMEDANGNAEEFRVAENVPVVPAVLSNGLLADLTALVQHLPGFTPEATWQVWLGPHAPADAVTLLERQGLLVQGQHTVAQRVTVLGRQGPALALELLLVCAVAGAVLAVGATATAVAASGRRRSFELAALRAVGVRRAALVRSSFLEQSLLLVTAVIFGIPAGWVAARLSMSTIPEFSDTTPVPSSYTPALTPIGIFAAAFVVLLALTAVFAAIALVRAAVPARLREAEQ